MRKLLIVLLLIGLSAKVHAQALSTMTFSGNFVNSSGDPVDGTATLLFEIYDSSTGGSALWTETDEATCEDGLCSATLGDGTSFGSLFSDNDDLYLAITINGSALSPRQSLSSCSFAQRASTADTLAASAVTTTILSDSSVTTTKIVDGTIATTDLADSAITAAKITDGTIAAGDLADSAVTSAKILDGTIATADLADSAVTTAKIVDSTIAAGDIADDTLDFSQFKDTPTLDSSLTLNQGTSTWAQTYSGTTGTAFGFGCTGAVTTSPCTTFDLDNTSATVAAVSISNKGSGVSFRVNDDGTHTDTTPFMVDASGNVGIRTNNPLSGLHIGAGGLSVHRVAPSSDYTASCSDFIIGVTAVPLTVTLPAASTCGAGKILLIKDETITANTTTKILTIARGGSDLIDGATTKALTSGGAAALLYSDGSSNWFGF